MKNPRKIKTVWVWWESASYSNVFLEYTKVAKPVFFLSTNPLWGVVRMTITDSVRGPKTSLDVFPVIPEPFTHPGNTQKQVFSTPDHVPYYDLVRGWWPKKIQVCVL